jgi:ketosteroid isomerase-like protein
MLKKSVFIVSFVLTFSSIVFAQNPNSNTNKVRPRMANTNTAQTPTPTPAAKPTPGNKRASTETLGSEAVLASFNKILDGIRHANVDEVTVPYWNSRQLVLFNNNGTVTKTWEQMHKNRESSYPDLKDVKLEVRDVHVLMLGRDGAAVTCLWTQSQTFKGTPETSSGRMTLVFKRIGKDWKAVHLHTSPDRPDPSRVPASEQTPTPATKP